ncbi:MAG: hypothetical protein U0Q11_24745 [Vicinamibacterales bacterium]
MLLISNLVSLLLSIFVNDIAPIFVLAVISALPARVRLARA